MFYNINYKDISTNNLNITNLYINNFHNNNINNIFYINIFIHTDLSNNYYINLNQSSTTFIIQNIFSTIYSKFITKIDKNNKTLFFSNNHNLKNNDIIFINNIDSLLNTNLQNNFILFQVHNITNNTFNLKSYNNFNNSINNIFNIVHSSAILTNSFFNLISNKNFKQITSVSKFNIIHSNNHQLQINTIIQLFNIKYNSQDILFSNYNNSSILFIITNIINNNTFEIKTYNDNNTNIFTIDSNITYGFLQIHTLPTLNKSINFILPINNTNSIGYTYDIIINDININSISIKTFNNTNFLIGFSKFSSTNITGSDFIYTSTDNSSQFSLSNLPISQSKFKIINISKNIWYLQSYIFNNKITYNIKYDISNNILLFNDSILTNRLILYKNFIYEFNIEHNSLLNNNIIFIDSSKNYIFKNIITFGKIGTPSSKIIFYINDNFNINDLYDIKYINTSISNYNTNIFAIISNFNNPFI